MKRTMFLAAVLVMLATTAVPALAQTSGGPGAAGPPAYALQGDQLVIEGDQVIDCPSFTRSAEQAGNEASSGVSDAPRELEQVQRYAQLCYQYGFSPSGVADTTNSPGTSNMVLPETGGVTPLPAATGLLLASAALVVAGRRGTR